LQVSETNRVEVDEWVIGGSWRESWESVAASNRVVRLRDGRVEGAKGGEEEGEGAGGEEEEEEEEQEQQEERRVLVDGRRNMGTVDSGSSDSASKTAMDRQTGCAQLCSATILSGLGSRADGVHVHG